MSEIEKIHPSLPIFAYLFNGKGVVYAPGKAMVLEEGIVRNVTRYYQQEHSNEKDEIAQHFLQYASDIHQRWEKQQLAPYKPQCLTLYLSNACNLACRYCFSAGSDRKAGRVSKTNVLDIEHVRRAATFVAKHCSDKGLPFTLVIHGGGEPSLHFSLLKRVVELTRDIADQFHLPWWGYIATNGVMSRNRARWLANNFNQIGLSCDGPPSIQNLQRPTVKLRETATTVESNARLFAELGVPFSVRATITPSTVSEQIPIVQYLVHELGCKDLRFEPVYGEHVCGAFRATDADDFANHFIQAQRFANQLGVDLQISGVRQNELHGPYCNTQRNVLLLLPNGKFSACFLNHDGDEAALNIGQAFSGDLIEENKVAQLQKQFTQIPSQCEECVNIYHCSRDCPDECVFTQPPKQWQGGFRCRINKRLTQEWLKSCIEQRCNNVGGVF